MSEESNGHDSPSRLDRLEKIVEALPKVQVDIHQTRRLLLRAQVLMSEDIRTLTARLSALAERADERSRETDARFTALAEAQTAMMGTVDHVIRRLPSA